jgi:hypothetical protein
MPTGPFSDYDGVILRTYKPRDQSISRLSHADARFIPVSLLRESHAHFRIDSTTFLALNGGNPCSQISLAAIHL